MVRFSPATPPEEELCETPTPFGPELWRQWDKNGPLQWDTVADLRTKVPGKVKRFLRSEAWPRKNRLSDEFCVGFKVRLDL